MILFGTLILCLIICIIGSTSKKMLENKKLFFIILAFLLVIAVGLRVYNFGDYAQYNLNFNNYSKMTWGQIFASTNKEYLQSCMLKILSILGFGSQSYFFIASFITIYGFFSFIIKKSRNPYITLMLFISMGCIFTMCNITRQYISISFLLLAYLSFDENKILKSIIFAFCAFQFHVTAILPSIIFVVYKLFLKRINILKNKKALFGINLILMFMISPIFEKLFLNTSSSLEIKNLSSISDLASIGQYGTNTANKIYILVGIILYILLIFFRKTNKTENKIEICNVFNCYYFIFVLFGCMNSVLYFRLADYFILFLLTDISNEFVKANRCLNNYNIIFYLGFMMTFIILSLGPNIQYLKYYMFYF